MSVLAQLHSDALRRAQALLIFGASACALPVLYFFSPERAGFFPPCPFRWFTGWLCPGCGSLRAMHFLLHGEFAAALAMNPLLVVLLPLLLFLLTRYFLSFLFEHAEPVLPARVVWLLLAITLLYAVARNLPWWPATLAAA